jgi:hypothetical protein
VVALLAEYLHEAEHHEGFDAVPLAVLVRAMEG